MGTGYDYSCPAAHTQCILCLQYLTLLSLHTITTVYFVSKVYCNLLSYKCKESSHITMYD